MLVIQHDAGLLSHGFRARSLGDWAVDVFGGGWVSDDSRHIQGADIVLWLSKLRFQLARLCVKKMRPCRRRLAAADLMVQVRSTGRSWSSAPRTSRY